jgi:hypothetical protein
MRVDPKYAPLLTSAVMAVAMSLVISLVQAIIRLGFTPRLVPAWLASFGISVLVAVPTAILVSRPAQRLVSHLTGPPRRPTRQGEWSTPDSGDSPRARDRGEVRAPFEEEVKPPSVRKKIDL